MTVETITYFTEWQDANGVNKNWVYNFPMPDNDSVVVLVRDVADPLIIARYTENFTRVEVDTNNGTIIYPAIGAALGSSKQVRIVREVPYTQMTQIGSEGAFNPEIHEKAMDKLTMICQQLFGAAERSLRFPLGDSVTELPSVRAGRVLAFDVDGNPVAGPTPEEISAAASYATAAAGYRDQAEAYKDDAHLSALNADASAVAAAASAAEAAALWNPASYSTTSQIEAMLADYPLASEVTAALADYTPKTRKLIAGAGITINGATEATLGGDVTIAAVSTDTGVPIGGYLFYPSTKTPTGRWIAGNGAAISRTTYADLDTAMYVGDSANATEPAWYRCMNPANPSTSRSTTGAYIVLPDLRGVAPRFLDDGRGLDPSRAVNTYQSDMIGSHSHTVASGGVVNAPSLQASSTNAGATYSTSASGGAETRMKNIAARGWIKF